MNKKAMATVIVAFFFVGCAALDRAACDLSGDARHVLMLVDRADREARAALLRIDDSNTEKVLAAWSRVQAHSSRTLQAARDASYHIFEDAGRTVYLDLLTLNEAAVDAYQAVTDALSRDRDAVLAERADTAKQAVVRAAGAAVKSARRAAALYSQPEC